MLCQYQVLNARLTLVSLAKVNSSHIGILIYQIKRLNDKAALMWKKSIKFKTPNRWEQ